MVVDKTIVVLAVVLLVILGIFALAQFGDGQIVEQPSRSVSQYGGGGWGR